MCGKEEWDKFQNVLGSEYQLLVYSLDYFNTNMYSGAVCRKQIYLYHAANHFSIITLLLPSQKEHTFANIAKSVTMTEGPTFVKTV